MKNGLTLLRGFSVAAVLLISLAVSAQTSVGTGGGGSMYAPAISPFDANTMFVACDMTGLYRSIDGGGHWTMLDGRQVQGSTRFSVVFDPNSSGHVLGFQPFQGLKESFDNGATWALISSPFTSPNLVVSAAYTGNSSMPLLVATANVLYASSASGGFTAQTLANSDSSINLQEIVKVIGAKISGASQQDLFVAVNGFHVDIVNGTKTFITTDINKWNGAAWGLFNVGLPPNPRTITDLAVGTDATKYAVHAALGANGVYRLESAGQAWSSVTGNLTTSATDPGFQYVLVAMAASDPNTVYAANASDCAGGVCGAAAYKGTFSSGMTWNPTFTGFQNQAGTNVTPGWIEVAEPNSGGWGFGFGGGAHGLAVSPQGAGTVLFTNNAAVYGSINGGTSWTPRYTTQISPGVPTLSSSWQTNGLDITNAWNYVIHPDPTKSNIRFIANTDIGLSRSEDGAAWISVSPMDLSDPNNPRKWNNFYQLAFEYPNGSHIWAAVSHQHDIPYDTQLNDSAIGSGSVHGGVFISSDDGKSWTQVSATGLPDAPVVSVIYDPGARAVYASVWRNGVYQLANGSASWMAVGAFPVPHHPYQLAIDSTGALWATGAASINSLTPGSLYKFDGTTWQPQIQGIPIGTATLAPTNFTFDPTHAGDLYLATESIAGGGGGGVYKFSSGVWSNTGLPLDNTLHDALSVYAPIFINGRLYATTVGQGTYAMVGGAWQRILTEVPFLGTQRLVLDNGNLPLTSTWTFDSGHFTAPSFTINNPPSTMSSLATVLTTATATIAGSEQSSGGGTPGTAGSGGQITISGREQTSVSTDFSPPKTFYDHGLVSITVGSYTATVIYQQGSTAATVATALRNVFNGDAASPVTANAVSTTAISFTSKTTGAATNYAVSVASVTNQGDFGNPSFSGSPASTAMTGGSDATPITTVFDQGTVSITVNGHSTSVSYGQGSSNTSVALALATAINNDSAAAVTASAGGNVVNLMGKTSTLFPVSANSSFDTAHFGAASFTMVSSGLSLH
jgi:hypothetical protein